MLLSDDQIAIITQATDSWIDKASALYQLTLPKIDIRFDLRGQTSGMFCRYKKQNFIRYNQAIFVRYFDENIEQTVPHEVAHYVVFHMEGSAAKPHGKEWRRVMADFGLPAEVTSKLDVSDLKTRRLIRHRYSCGCSDHELTSIRHNRIQAGKRQYGCPKCKQILVAQMPS